MQLPSRMSLRVCCNLSHLIQTKPTFYINNLDWLDSLIKSTIPASGGDDDSDSIDEEITEMTDSIIMEARLVALDVLNGMRTAAVAHVTEAQELQIIFNATALLH
jgi:hypothetical protein